MNNVKPVALLLTPVLPQPGGSGRAFRAWDWLQTLGKTHRVHVVVTDPSIKVSMLHHDLPAEKVIMVGHTLQLTSRTFSRFGMLFPFLVLGSQKFVVDWLHPVSKKILDICLADLADEPVKHILAYRFYLHDVAISLSERFPEAVLELDMDDYEPQTRLSFAGAQARLGRYADAVRCLSAAIQYWFLERQVAKRYHTVYLASEGDCPQFPRGKGTVIACRPNKIVFPAYLPHAPAIGELRMLFVGSLSYPPNEEAVRILATGILPELQRRLKRPFRLFVIGRQPSPEVKSLLKQTEHVDFVPDADDLAAFYADSHIVLIPLRAGGGTKLKTLEAFAYRRPVISTRHGVRGLGAVVGEHYLHAETPMEFAEAVIRLEADPDLSERIAQAGWELCSRTFRVE